MASIAGDTHTDTPTAVSVGVGQKAPITENLQDALSGTVGGASYPFRVALAPIVFAPATNYQDRAAAPGTLLTTVDLDDLGADPMIKSLKEKFMTYHFKDLTIVLKCASPWSTASGTVEIAYNPDPANPISSTTPAKALEQIMRLTKSQQISAKTDAVIQLPDSQLCDPIYGNLKRYCKKSTPPIPRMERFGQIVVAMRTEPAKGDGSQWAVSLMGSVEFSGPTLNNEATLVRYDMPLSVADQTDIRLVDFKGAYTLALSVPSAEAPVAVGDAVFMPPMDIILTVADADNDELPVEQYRQSYSNAQFSKAAADEPVIFYFPTLMGSVTAFSAPTPSEIISNDTAVNLLYTIDNVQYDLANGAGITPAELRHLPRCNVDQDFSRRAALAHQFSLPQQQKSNTGPKVFTWFKDRFL